jgi:hypothetical protein
MEIIPSNTASFIVVTMELESESRSRVRADRETAAEGAGAHESRLVSKAQCILQLNKYTVRLGRGEGCQRYEQPS